MSEVNVKALITKGGSDLIGHSTHRVPGVLACAKSRSGSRSSNSKKAFCRPIVLRSTHRPLVPQGGQKLFHPPGETHKTVIDSLLHKHHKPWLSPCLVSLGILFALGLPPDAYNPVDGRHTGFWQCAYFDCQPFQGTGNSPFGCFDCPIDLSWAKVHVTTRIFFALLKLSQRVVRVCRPSWPSMYGGISAGKFTSITDQLRQV